MATKPGPALTALTLGDPVDLWGKLGFTVEHGSAAIDGIELRLGATEPGISGWSLDAVSLERCRHVPAPTVALAPAQRPTHPNGISGVDHIVLMVGDLDATRADLAALGVEIRREQAVVLGGRPVVQMFAWVGPAILEVVGPAQPSSDQAHLWGITFAAPNLEATASAIGPYAGPIRDAVQPGRRIFSLDTRVDHGSVRLAVMSPHRA